MKTINWHVCTIFSYFGSFLKFEKEQDILWYTLPVFHKYGNFYLKRNAKHEKENTSVISVIGKKIRKKITRMVITLKHLNMIYVTWSTLLHFSILTLLLNHLKKEPVVDSIVCRIK